MGLLNSSLQIGRSAILSYESALQTIGNNIGNVGNADYTRLVPQLDPIQGVPIAGGLQPGAGVALTDIQRHLDEALEARLRLAIGARESAFAQQGAMVQVEVLFDDLNGTGVGSQMTRFFQSFDELQNTPDNAAIRDLEVMNGVQRSELLRRPRGQPGALGEALDSELVAVAAQGDEAGSENTRPTGRILTTHAGARGAGERECTHIPRLADANPSPLPDSPPNDQWLHTGEMVAVMVGGLGGWGGGAGGDMSHRRL